MINFEVALRKKDPNGKALLLKVRTRGLQRAWAEGMEGDGKRAWRANGRLGC